MYKLKIFTVDDEPDILDLLSATLETDFEIYQAACGKEALSKIPEISPDLIILDFSLPDMTGPEIAAQLRKDSMFLHTPILMLTGRGETEDKVIGLESGVDDYMVKPFDPTELITRIKMLIKRSTIKLDANPLTRLPGNVSINNELDTRIKNQETFAVLYFDLDNFKAFNDYYGFERGDEIIKKTGRLLIETSQNTGTVTDFIGHIGGDDFVIITSVEASERLAKKVIDNFDKLAPAFFDKPDLEKGYIETKGRDGQIQKFGILSISIGIIINKDKPFTHIAEIGSVGAEVKGLAKKFNGSKYIIDQRHC
ncbi:MAG: response regulator [Candidatus Omnitrophica bacterium]|nr:response regulator [Candidatus Omnitrophota bacterium]MDD5081273.1 response regulator [Candidatus Omnitrophota bacterium]MDD5441089.1 response regulator [Candidatus Omnitrophota bacterium]